MIKITKDSTINERLEFLRKPLLMEDIEVRVQSATQYGANILLYKTARTDKKRLNDSGLKWQNTYSYDTKGNLMAKVSYYDTDINEWVSRVDVGTESQTEKEKGSYSDAFKRACFNFGIGDELYSTPSIQIKKVKQNTKGRWVLDIPFGVKVKVTKFTVSEDRITEVELSVNGQSVFYWNEEPYQQPTAYQQPVQPEYTDQQVKTKQLIELGNKAGKTEAELLAIIANNIDTFKDYATDLIDIQDSSYNYLVKRLNKILAEKEEPYFKKLPSGGLINTVRYESNIDPHVQTSFIAGSTKYSKNYEFPSDREMEFLEACNKKLSVLNARKDKLENKRGA